MNSIQINRLKKQFLNSQRVFYNLLTKEYYQITLGARNNPNDKIIGGFIDYPFELDDQVYHVYGVAFHINNGDVTEISFYVKPGLNSTDATFFELLEPYTFKSMDSTWELFTYIAVCIYKDSGKFPECFPSGHCKKPE